MDSPRTAYVYLGDSMSGLTLAQSKQGWRADFARQLKSVRAACLLLTPGL